MCQFVFKLLAKSVIFERWWSKRCIKDYEKSSMLGTQNYSHIDTICPSWRRNMYSKLLSRIKCPLSTNSEDG